MRPAKPILEVAGRCAFLIMRPRAYAAVLVCAPIVLYEDAVVAAAIGDFRIIRLRHGVCAFAIGDLVPSGERDHSSGVRTRSFKRTFVLLRAVDVIRKLVVNV